MRYNDHDATPRTSTIRQQMEQEREEMEKAAERGRESSMERSKPIDRGMRTTMRESPEYREQKADTEGVLAKDLNREAELEHDLDTDDVENKGVFERAKERLLT